MNGFIKEIEVTALAALERPRPAMQDAPPQAGRFAKVIAPEYRGAHVYHGLYLPSDWQAGGRYPVIVEYAGNLSPPVCPGTVEDCKLGYYASGGSGYLWLVLPYVNSVEKKNQLTWWGDVQATVEYCKFNVKRVCENWGGDPQRIFLTGFSRGAIACSYIGLHDDSIASLWAGFMPYAHFDAGRYASEGTTQRLRRLKDRPVLIMCGELDEPGKSNSLAGRQMLEEMGMHPEYLEIPRTPHVHTWIEQGSLERDQLRDWLRRHARVDQ